MEKINIRKRKNQEIRRDKVFYSLVKVMLDDYFKIKEEFKEHIPYEIGTEFTTHLSGAFILLEPSDKEIKRYCRKISSFDPISLDDEEIIIKLKENLKEDSARIIKNNELVKITSVYAYHQAEKKKGKELSDLIKDYTPFSDSHIGERITAALAFSLATKNYTYIISQTINPTENDIKLDGKLYSEIGTGKVAEFGAKGLTRIVTLENNSEDIPKDDMLDGNVFINQKNYEFKDNIYLTNEAYLTNEDIEVLLEKKYPKKLSLKEKLRKIF